VDALPEQPVGLLAVFATAVAAFLARRKLVQLDEHLEYVDRRLGSLEREAITKDDLDSEVRKVTDTINMRFSELKAGQDAIVGRLIDMLKDRL
jgi:hypothetical protein